MNFVNFSAISRIYSLDVPFFLAYGKCYIGNKDMHILVSSSPPMLSQSAYRYKVIRKGSNCQNSILLIQE